LNELDEFGGGFALFAGDDADGPAVGRWAIGDANGLL
jgi:hypothetical protein